MTPGKTLVLSGLSAKMRERTLDFTVKYVLQGNALTIETEYKVGAHIQSLPRFGFEFGVKKKYNKFAFVGFGKTESYVDS